MYLVIYEIGSRNMLFAYCFARNSAKQPVAVTLMPIANGPKFGRQFLYKNLIP